ncbi:MAG: hypothetical protein NXH75_06470, partial [Halobacteriovoraceae bacterium]|nr:hypothetical protein [Halobacteriovoraceae bacterium]
MQNIVFKCPVKASVNEVKKGFNLELFKALKPPLVQLEVTRFDGCEKGDEVHLSVGLGLKVSWVSLITEDHQDDNQWFFVDEGKVLPPPLKKWRHIHSVLKDGDNAIIVDDISFTSNNRAMDFLLRPAMFLQFSGRYNVY